MLGNPGSGKSFFAKGNRKLLFATPDSHSDSGRGNEYTALVEQLQRQGTLPGTGQLKLSESDGFRTYPPMWESPMLRQADFLLSQCELMMASYGNPLMPIEKSLIDRCISLVYRDYLKRLTPENMPILGDLYQCLVGTG